MKTKGQKTTQKNTAEDGNYSNNKQLAVTERGALLSMIVTEFHFLLLYQYRLCACTRITHEIVYELELTQSFYGQVQGLIRDNNTSTLWMYSKNSLYQILLEQEDRNVWKLYLQQAKAGDGKGKLIEKRIKKRISCSNSSYNKSSSCFFFEFFSNKEIKYGSNTNIYFKPFFGFSFVSFYFWVEFEYAFQHAKTNEQQDLVRALQADHYFNKNDFIVAARYYAKTKRSFEEVSLKFISTNNISSSTPKLQIKLKKALKTYLLEKLKNLPHNDKTQKTILSMWLVEMYLNEMNDLDNISREDDSEVNNVQLTQLITEFKNFLRTHKDQVCGLNRECSETTYQLISAHGQMTILLYFAELIEGMWCIKKNYIVFGNAFLFFFVDFCVCGICDFVTKKQKK